MSSHYTLSNPVSVSVSKEPSFPFKFIILFGIGSIVKIKPRIHELLGLA